MNTQGSFETVSTEPDAGAVDTSFQDPSYQGPGASTKAYHDYIVIRVHHIDPS